MLFVEICVSLKSDKFSLDSLMVVVDSRIFTVCFQGTDEAFFHHNFADIAFDYIFSRSEASIDAVVKVSFQSFVQALQYLFVRKFVVQRPSIECFNEEFCLKNTQSFIQMFLDDW